MKYLLYFSIVLIIINIHACEGDLEGENTHSLRYIPAQIALLNEYKLQETNHLKKYKESVNSTANVSPEAAQKIRQKFFEEKNQRWCTHINDMAALFL